MSDQQFEDELELSELESVAWRRIRGVLSENRQGLTVRDILRRMSFKKQLSVIKPAEREDFIMGLIAKLKEVGRLFHLGGMDYSVYPPSDPVLVRRRANARPKRGSRKPKPHSPSHLPAT